MQGSSESKTFSPTILSLELGHGHRVLQLQEAESSLVKITISRDKGKIKMLRLKKKKKSKVIIVREVFKIVINIRICSTFKRSLPEDRCACLCVWKCNKNMSYFCVCLPLASSAAV